MEKAAVLFFEFRFKILYKSIPIDLSLENLPVHDIMVDFFRGPHSQQIFFAVVPQKIHSRLIHLLE